MECPYQAKCGGCIGLDADYQAQLAVKQKRMEQLLGKHCPVLPILGMEQPLHYRNKSIATFAMQGNRLVSGTYQRGTHRVVPQTECALQMECLNRTQAAVLSAARKCRYVAYDEDKGIGLLRHCLVRCSRDGKQALVCIVTPGPAFPGSKNFVKELVKQAPWVTGVVQNINPRSTSAVLGKTEKPLWGKPFLQDTLLGHRFSLSAQSFYQVNPTQTERLYLTALDFAGLNGSQTVLDTYCGIGTIGLCAAPRAKAVLGVELNPAAARNAVENARRNDAANARFACGDAAQWMLAQADSGTSPDVVFLDPPRAGSTPEFITAVGRMRPGTVVYVSCDPDTLTRDVSLFEKEGYRAIKCQPVDMFPFTPHVESVVLITRKDK